MKCVLDIKQSTFNRESRLSTHIATRLYRSPEVILYEKHYHKAMDIWSCGAIMGDLFGYICIDPAVFADKTQRLKL
jgi:serine/threonine protein kinase